MMDVIENIRHFIPPSLEAYAEEILKFLLQHQVVATSAGFLILLYLRQKLLARGDAIELVAKEPMPVNKEYNGIELPKMNKPKNAVYKKPSKIWMIRKLFESPLRSILVGKAFRNLHTYRLDQYVMPEKPTFKPLVLPDEILLGKSSLSDNDVWNFVKPRKPSDYFEFRSISSLLEAYKNGTKTPTDVAKRIISILREMKRDGKELNAMVEYYEDSILKSAELSTRRWQEGRPLSVFDGIPVAVKDQYFLSGCHTRCGTDIPWFDKPKTQADEDGMIKKLRAGGAVLIGITNMHQLGIGITGINPSRYHGTSLNPYNLRHCTGGSSGGSAAAVASGLCPVALGTDAGGSIRVPAANCGVVGLKATMDRFPTEGGFIGTPTLGHAGVLCATVRDTALAYAFLADKDQTSTVNPSVTLDDFDNSTIDGIRIGVDWQWVNDAEEEIRNACCKVINGLKNQLGATIVDIRFPEKEEMYLAHTVTALTEFSTNGKMFYGNYDTFLNFDCYMSLTLGNQLTGTQYNQGARQRTRQMNSLKYIFTTVDFILTPAFPRFQPVVDEEMKKCGYFDQHFIGSIVQSQTLGNLTGIPGLTLPIDYSQNGLPIGILLQAPWWREDVLLRAALAIEKYVKKKPPSYYFDILQD